MKKSLWISFGVGAVGGLCLLAASRIESYIDDQGFLHEPFALIATGWILVVISSVASFLIVAIWFLRNAPIGTVTSGLLVAFAVSVATAGVSGLAGYLVAKEKWRLLGVKAGEIHGQAMVMRALCDFKVGEKAPDKPAYRLSIKASQMDVVRRENGLHVYCQE